MTACGSVDYPPGSAAGVPCGWAAVFAVTVTCPDKHESRESLCEDHAAAVAAGSAFCGWCAKEGRNRDLTVTAKEYLP